MVTNYNYYVNIIYCYSRLKWKDISVFAGKQTPLAHYESWMVNVERRLNTKSLYLMAELKRKMLVFLDKYLEI